MLLFGYYAGKMSRSVSELTNNEAIIQIIFHTCLIFIKKWREQPKPVAGSWYKNIAVDFGAFFDK